ncbi:MAG: lycopene cyclase domain-containing protein [Cyclobacteriaceae bacterium]|nr:lycopene cyclase domain-containing protein [Cyclobacteriaceae bacterium]
MEKYTYLLLDILTILFPLLFSFVPRENFSKKWKYLWPAILIPAIIFIVWDEFFTQIGVWGFNTRYLSGIYFFHLPIEEILFFICIPYACVFTYEAVNYLRKAEVFPDNGKRLTWVLILGLLVVGIKHYDKWYTSVTFLSTSLFLIFLITVVKPKYLGRFYFAYLFILIPFFIVNGILTGTAIEEPVVWYNNAENLGIRIMTIPFEDTFYGMLLILMNVSIFEALQKRSTSLT